MKSLAWFTCCAVALFGYDIAMARAGGLSCSLGEIVVENLQIGRSYSLTQLTNTQISVTNTDDHTVKLRMDVLIPEREELKLNAEPIPDSAWIQLSETEFFVPPSGRVESAIQITIPDDDRYLGQRFQVMIWSHTVPSAETGMFLACGLKSRLIFTTDSVRSKEVISTSTGHIDALRMEPSELYWTNTASGNSITVFNDGDWQQGIHLQARTVRESLSSLTASYEDCPNPGVLFFSEDSFELPPHGSRQIELRLDSTAAMLEPGRKYMLIIAAQSGSEAVQSQVYSRVYFSLN